MGNRMELGTERVIVRGDYQLCIRWPRQGALCSQPLVCLDTGPGTEVVAHQHLAVSGKYMPEAPEPEDKDGLRRAAHRWALANTDTAMPIESWALVPVALESAVWVLATAWAVGAGDPTNLDIKLYGGRALYEAAWCVSTKRTDWVRLARIDPGPHEVVRRVDPAQPLLVRRSLVKRARPTDG